MSTALSVYYAFAHSATITTANQLYTGTGGSPTTAQNLTSINGSTGYGEIPAQGSSAAWAALGSIGTPTGKGFFLDATTLDGQDLIAGNYSGIIRFNTQATGTVTATIFVRVYRYRPSTTTYTQIVSMSLASQSITNTITSYSLPSTSVGSNTSFATGDKLYIDAWLNITTNTSSAGQQIKHNRQSTDTTTFVGDTQAVTVTPGYSPSGTVVQKDLSLRVLMSAIGQKNLSTRARLSAIGQKNLSIRTLVSAIGLKDLTFRARVSVLTLKNLSTRTLVSALSLKNLSTRTLVSALSLKNLSTRTLLSALSLRNLSTRTRVSAIGQRDLSFRALINSANVIQKNLSLRVLVSALNQKNLSMRARLSATGKKDLSLRALVSALVQKNLAVRALVSAIGQKNLSTRTLVSASRKKDLTLRAILGILLGKDLTLRALISGRGQRDLALRILIAPPISTSRLAPQTGSFYAGTGAMLPIAIPPQPYIVNGLALDTPSICTAPMTSNGVRVPAGSVFSLCFINPSTQTQALLTSFPTATMTFALYTGEQVTASVRIQTTTGSTIWQVLCTTLTATQVTRWKVQSQFP